jgi:hypothetical protein
MWRMPCDTCSVSVSLNWVERTVSWYSRSQGEAVSALKCCQTDLALYQQEATS